MVDLTNRVVVVTGGNSGLGLAMARGVGKAGAAVVIWSRTESKNEAAVDQLRAEGISASSVACDTADEGAVEAAMATTLGLHGRVDSFIANAGIADETPFVDLTLHEWRRIMSTNLDGTFLCTRAAARHFVDRGAGGAMVVVSSTISRYGGARQAGYAVSKHGLVGLGRTLAVELARAKVRVNILVPGWTATAMNTHLRADDSFVRATTARTPARRWADPSEFEEIAAFLSDPTQTFHTGNEVVVDGGYTIY
jgi:hypothetical protein